MARRPSQPERPHVLLMVETSIAYGRGILRGINRWQQTHRRWSMFLEQHELAAPPPAWLSRWRGDGVLCRVTTPDVARLLRAGGLPVIDLNDLHEDLGFVHLWSDHRELGRLAADHLLERGFRTLAFCGFSDQRWSRLRLEGFAGRAAEAGLQVAVHESDWFGPAAPAWEESQEMLRRWLVGLAPPVGIMACNDLRGQHVLDAARRGDLAIPEQVAVIGVDDDALLCELCDPPLSSVRPDPEEIGYRAAELLDGMMAGSRRGGRQPPAAREIRIPPLGVTTRQSTDILAVADADIAAVLRLIRERGCNGLTMQQVVAASGMSRSSLERKFRDVVGHTPQAEIRTVQIKRIRELLAETDLPLERIADLVGLSQASYLSHAFKRETGETPRDYRRRAQAGTTRSSKGA